MTKEQEEKVEKVLDVFDFEKVKKVMDFLDWKWATDDGGIEVPTMYQIIKFARKMLCKALEHENSAGGGFAAFYDKENDILELSFSIEEADSDY